ncbi:hypothetical protein SRHO_G00164730 [Serrasalmus rhombeus]
MPFLTVRRGNGLFKMFRKTWAYPKVNRQRITQRLLEQEKAITQPVLQLFNSDILQVKENDTDLTKTIINSTLEYLNSKYEDPEVEELISLATILDPRFHTQYMEIQIMKDPDLPLKHLYKLQGQQKE